MSKDEVEEIEALSEGDFAEVDEDDFAQLVERIMLLWKESALDEKEQDTLHETYEEWIEEYAAVGDDDDRDADPIDFVLHLSDCGYDLLGDDADLIGPAVQLVTKDDNEERMRQIVTQVAEELY